MGFFKSFFLPKATPEKIMNTGLNLAMAWGQNWLEPIQNRLSKKFPKLTQQELDAYNNICQSAMNMGYDFIYKELETATDKGEKVKETELKEKSKNFLLSQYPWISSMNFKRIFSQGIYYAWKEGLDKCLI